MKDFLFNILTLPNTIQRLFKDAIGVGVQAAQEYLDGNENAAEVLKIAADSNSAPLEKGVLSNIINLPSITTEVFKSTVKAGVQAAQEYFAEDENPIQVLKVATDTALPTLIEPVKNMASFIGPEFPICTWEDKALGIFNTYVSDSINHYAINGTKVVEGVCKPVIEAGKTVVSNYLEATDANAVAIFNDAANNSFNGTHAAIGGAALTAASVIGNKLIKRKRQKDAILKSEKINEEKEADDRRLAEKLAKEAEQKLKKQDLEPPVGEMEHKHEEEIKPQGVEEIKLQAEKIECNREEEIKRQEAQTAERNRQAEIERNRQAEIERNRQAEIERNRQAEIERNRQAEIERNRQAAERDLQIAIRPLQVEETRRQVEEATRRQAEEATRRQAEEATRRQAEEVARRQAEEVARRQAEEATRRQAEEVARRQAEEAARRHQAEEAARRHQAEEVARRQAEEVAHRHPAEEVAHRHPAEEVARRRQAEEAARKAQRKEILSLLIDSSQQNGSQEEEKTRAIVEGMSDSAIQELVRQIKSFPLIYAYFKRLPEQRNAKLLDIIAKDSPQAERTRPVSKA